MNIVTIRYIPLTSGNWPLRHFANLERFTRPYMRLWFYAAFIRIEFGSSVRSFHLNYTIKQTFRCAVAFWKSCVCKYSITFQVTKLKLLSETLKNKKYKILAWYRNKMRRYRQRNPKCVDWHWTNFQVYVT